MNPYENPDCDHTPWGMDEHRDRDYVHKCIDRWQEGVSEAMFLIEAAEVAPGSRVLDLGCAIGRHSLTFARAGCEVVGIDLNNLAIKRAQELTKSKNLRGTFIHGDFREIGFHGEFDVVLMLDDTFGLMNEDGNRSLLKKAASALAAQGRLVLDTYNREHMVERLGIQKGIGRNWKEQEGVLSSKVSSFDLVQSRFNSWSEYMVLKTGEKVREPVRSIRLYTLCELTYILAGLGLHVHGTYGDLTGSDYNANSERMTVIYSRVS